MKFAMILAAGEGRRMRPLTDTTPKPLIKVAQKTLLERHIEALVNAGFTDLVINASYRADQLAAFCGDGRQWGCRIHLSMPPPPPPCSMLAVVLMSCTSTAVSPARANIDFGGQGGCSLIASLYRLISEFGPPFVGRPSDSAGKDSARQRPE